MKVIVAGMGIQGRKRRKIAGDDVLACVDPVAEGVDFKRVQDVPLDRYDAALVCTPDNAKVEILTYLLSNRKHVLVEKPLLADEAVIQSLLKLATANHVTCYTAYNHRFEPHIAKMKEFLTEGVASDIYSARFFYGNGTAMDVKASPWRDKGMGVFPDLGSHLLDMCLFLFGPVDGEWRAWSFDKFENQSFDRAICASTGTPRIELEMSLLSWRNTFTADLYGKGGSIHINGLCKWGPSVLTVRTRVLPSGRPKEEVFTLESPDPTWSAEYEHFKNICARGESNLDNDIWIRSKMTQVEQSVAGAHA